MPLTRNLLTRRLVQALTAIALVAAWPALQAEEYFDNQRAKPFTAGAAVGADATVGGYAIYPGDRDWRFYASEVDGPNRFGVAYGTLTLTSPDQDDFFAQMWVTTNLGQSPAGFYLTGEPCKGEHLVSINHMRMLGNEGTSGNCLTIDPLVVTIGGRSLTVLDVRVTNAESGSRYYALRLVLDPAVLGLGDTAAADWSKAAVAGHAQRSRFLASLTDWGKQLQAGVAEAIGYNKPKDAFRNVPSFRSLQVGPGRPGTRGAPARTRTAAAPFVCTASHPGVA